MSSAARVVAVCKSAEHSFSKKPQDSIRLIANFGVLGDVHAGGTVQHRSRIRRDPVQPNLRQVHLMHAELFHELQSKGFDVQPGQMGENITTQGIDLLALARGTRLYIGETAIVDVTGLRDPCRQLDTLQPGLMDALIDQTPDGGQIYKAGIMGSVVVSGDVYPNDPITVELPTGPHEHLQVV